MKIDKNKGEKKINHGGARKGAGRQPIYKNPVSITFSLEKTDKDELKEKYGTKLNQLFNEWVTSKLDKK